MPFHVVSCDLTRSHRLELMGSGIWGIEGCHHSTCNCRWCLYMWVHSPTQCDKHYQLIADIVKGLALQTKLSFHGTKVITIILHGVFR